MPFKFFHRKPKPSPPALDWHSYQAGLADGRAIALKENNQLFQVVSNIPTTALPELKTTEPLSLPSKTRQDGQQGALRPGQLARSYAVKKRFVERLRGNRLVLSDSRPQDTDPLSFANLKTLPAHSAVKKPEGMEIWERIHKPLP